MARQPEPHRLQPDPPEGDRETIDRELARQDGGKRQEKPEATDDRPKPGR